MTVTDRDESISEELLDDTPQRAAELAARIGAVCRPPLPVEDVIDLEDMFAGLGDNEPALALVERLTAELAQARQAARDLTAALSSNREIGAATGILMAHRQVTQSEAFDLLRVASQARHVKLREVAREVVETGAVNDSEFLPATRQRSTPAPRTTPR